MSLGKFHIVVASLTCFAFIFGLYQEEIFEVSVPLEKTHPLDQAPVRSEEVKPQTTSQATYPQAHNPYASPFAHQFTNSPAKQAPTPQARSTFQETMQGITPGTVPEHKKVRRNLYFETLSRQMKEMQEEQKLKEQQAAEPEIDVLPEESSQTDENSVPGWEEADEPPLDYGYANDGAQDYEYQGDPQGEPVIEYADDEVIPY